MAREVDFRISPKKMYWIDMPSDILSVKERIELLLADVQIRRLPSELLHQALPEDAVDSAFLYNFDQIVAKNRMQKNQSAKVLAAKYADYIRAHHPGRALVHTTMLDTEIARTFRMADIPYLEKNIDVKSEVVATMHQIIKILFRNDPKLRRKYLRLELMEDKKYPIRLYSHRFKEIKNVQGFVKDISLNGVGLSLEVRDDYKHFHLKDPVGFTLEIERFMFALHFGFVTRVFLERNELGISFNVFNRKMITEENAAKINQQLQVWLRDFAIAR